MGDGFLGVETAEALTGSALMGGSFEEYMRMFGLSGKELAGERILDAASGVSSFCGEASGRGYDVIACDEAYGLPQEVLKRRAAESMGERPAADRREICSAFLRDYAVHRGRYIFSVFPHSRFADESFSLVLSSRFLFYQEELGAEFHRRAVREMLRVTSRELRIAPLLSIKGGRSKYVSQILHEAFDCGYAVSVENTKGRANTGGVLIIRKS